MINFHTGSLSGLIAIIGMDREADEAVIVLGNRDHAEMRHAIMWYVLDNSSESDKRDWNQEIFDLYAASDAESEKKQEEIVAARIKGTQPALPLESYAGTYRNEQLGDLVVSYENDQLKLISSMYEFPAKHWHVETFEINREQWDFRGYMTFTVGIHATVSGMKVFGADFEKLEVE